MGYAKDEMSGHGFRSMASILLNEQGLSEATTKPDARAGTVINWAEVLKTIPI
jgi:hypothetical protein